MMDIKLYYTPQTRAFRVRWLLEELGLDYKLEYINLFKGETNTEAYRAVHPLGHIPAIEIDGQSMFETGAICTWLTDQCPEKKLAPAYGSALRREYEKWMFFVPGEVEPPIFYHQIHKKVLPEQARVKEILPWLQERYRYVLEVLQTSLKNKVYLLGDNFSTADIMLGSTISWGSEMLQDFPALQDYVTRMQAREAHIRAMQD